MMVDMLDRRRFLETAAVGFAAALSGCGSEPAEQPEAAARKPNIILILADDLGYETLGCYGGTSYKTPHLDRLAAEGIRFDNGYAQPLCTPTRVELMTGEYNFRNWKAFGVLDPHERTFGHMMSKAGYKTCISGKWQLWSYNPPDFEPEFRGLGMRPEDAGFDDWFVWHARHTEEKGSRYADPTIIDNGQLVENAKGKYGPDLYEEHINGFMERHKDEPFFVYYPMALTHGPFNPTPHSKTWETGDRLASSAKDNFGDMVEYMDEVVGRLVAKVDELGIRENTLILFFGDNGTPLEVTSMMGDKVVKGGKGEPTDAGTHVPLIANWKGTTPAGTVNDDLIDSTDFFPTLAEIGGGTPPEGRTIDGVSFVPQLHGLEGHPKDIIICWHDPKPGWGKERFPELSLWARTKRFKLYDDGRLYDVPNDVLEQNPIAKGAGSPEAEAARAKLRAALDAVPADHRKPQWDPYAQFRS